MPYLVSYFDSEGRPKYARLTTDDLDEAKKMMRKKGVASTNCNFEKVDLSDLKSKPESSQSSPVNAVQDSLSSINSKIQEQSSTLVSDIRDNKLGRMSLIISIQLFVLLTLQLFIALAPDKWEYTVIAPSDYNLDSKMKEMGDDRWELVTARRATNSRSSSASYEMIFKRKK